LAEGRERARRGSRGRGNEVRGDGEGVGVGGGWERVGGGLPVMFSIS